MRTQPKVIVRREFRLAQSLWSRSEESNKTKGQIPLRRVTTSGDDCMPDDSETTPCEPNAPSSAEEFANAVEATRPRLRALLIARSRNAVDDALISDVLQEVCLRALRMRQDFVPRGPESLFRWLSSISINVAREFQRQRDRHDPIAASFEPAVGDVTQSRAARREERFDRLRDAIHGLPDDYREVLLLVKIEGLRVKDVAARFGKTPNAISRLLLRATRKLREEFGDTESLQLPPRSLAGDEHPTDE